MDRPLRKVASEAWEYLKRALNPILNMEDGFWKHLTINVQPYKPYARIELTYHRFADDPKLTSEGRTFEEAIVRLANLVREQQRKVKPSWLID